MFEKIENEIKKYEGLSYIFDEVKKYKKEFVDLDKYGMVLLGPDSFEQKEVKNILNFFENNDFKLVNLKIKRLNRTETETLFLPTSTCVKCADLKWWMIQDSANQGEFLCALFYCKTANSEENCLNKLNRFKGKSNPLLNNKGVIRYDYAAINVCLNLIHIPDTYGDFFKDVSAFYRISEIADIINSGQKDNNNLINKMYEINLLEDKDEKYWFETVLYKLKFRLACMIKDEVNLMHYYRKMNEKLRKEPSRENRNKLIASSIDEEKTQINNLIKNRILRIKEDSSWECLQREIREINILRILNIFTIPTVYKEYDKDIYMELQAYGLFVSNFEKLILNTTMLQWK